MTNSAGWHVTERLVAAARLDQHHDPHAKSIGRVPQLRLPEVLLIAGNLLGDLSL